MRIKSVQLTWFRGAAESISLEPGEKSIVVYGENGAGKSSFVDAVEYLIDDGKIGHLSHEQSGKRQEKGIPNTHTPEGIKTSFEIVFRDASKLNVQIKRDGSSTKSGSSIAAIETWDYRRTILRQDEVARFITNTKGEKYSALLPLLGLQHMEVAADNLRKLTKSIETESKLKEVKGALDEIHAKRTSIFGSDDNDSIASKIEKLHKENCPAKSATVDPIPRCKELNTALDAMIESSSADQKQHLILNDISKLNFKNCIAAIREASEKLAASIEPLIAEKLQVLESASRFSIKLDKEERLNCPACGLEISKNQFQAHVADERARLQEIIATFDERKKSVGKLCDEVTTLKGNIAKVEIKKWRDDAAKKSSVDTFIKLNEIDPAALRVACVESDLKNVEVYVLPIVDAAAAAALNAPSDVQQLTTNRRIVETALAIFESRGKAELVANVGVLKAFIGALEEGARKEIAEQSEAVIKAISADIQKMWDIIHPGEHIDEVRLHVPADTEKAIDVCLKFHGIDQDSPRLTLSEGFRNSLGLCIFLAMATREAAADRPIFLDDVVVSVDRNHRGMIVELFEKMFSDRQLIVLTHDRDWFIELKQRLQGENWSFKALMPYVSPTTGIRWSAKTFGFDDARKMLDIDPDQAGNTARKIMDIELAMRAEKLGIRLPYLHRERNDHRVAHDFLAQIISDGEKCFQKKKAALGTTKIEYEKYSEGLMALREADKLLVAWANKASHSFDVTKSEIGKLIDACEKALGVMDCPACSKPVFRFDDSQSEVMQCGCGEIRWRYGKS